MWFEIVFEFLQLEKALTGANLVQLGWKEYTEWTIYAFYTPIYGTRGHVMHQMYALDRRVGSCGSSGCGFNPRQAPQKASLRGRSFNRVLPPIASHFDFAPRNNRGLQQCKPIPPPFQPGINLLLLA